MAKTYKIAMMGDWDSVMCFKALGVESFPLTDVDEASALVHRLAKEDYGLVFITEAWGSKLDEAISEYRLNLSPAFIMIPGREGSLGIGEAYTQKAIIKAIGSDVI